MTQPVLSTERLILRPRTRAELEACYAMNREPGTLDFVDFPREPGSWDDMAAHRAFLDETFGYAYPPGLGYWTVVHRDAPRRFLGWVVMAPEDLAGPEVEIGWRFVTAARRRGYASEAAREMVRHGFETLGLGCLIADMYRANTGSMGVARKLGMRERPHPERTTDRYVLWELRREDWLASQRPARP